MGWWQVSADTLARSRFVVSPLAEAFASLKLLHRGVAAHPGERAWLDSHRPWYLGVLDGDPVTALLVRAGLGRNWIADFLTPTPRDGETFEEGVARVRAVPPDAVRAHLRLSLEGPLPDALGRDDLAERAAVLLERVWERAVLPYWDRRRRVLEADIVARTAHVGRGGWAAALDALRPGTTRWLGGNRFQVNLHAYPPREISGAELLFVPVTPKSGWVSWEDPGDSTYPAGAAEDTGYGTGTGEGNAYGTPPRYAVVYACSGVLARAGGGGDTRSPAALEALLGPGRARVLVLLGSPLSTSHLVAVTGQGLGSVGRHLRVLRDAGLVERRRAGRSVLYSRTPAGQILVEAADPPG